MIDALRDIFRDGGWVFTAIAAASFLTWWLILRQWLELRALGAGGGKRVETPAGESGGQAACESAALLADCRPGGARNRRLVGTRLAASLHTEALRFEQTLRMIAVLTGCMPLLGLLGTVSGMMSTFDALTLPVGPKVDALAEGVSEALITTQAGLVAAVPAWLMHGYLASRVRRHLDAEELACHRREASTGRQSAYAERS